MFINFGLMAMFSWPFMDKADLVSGIRKKNT